MPKTKAEFPKLVAVDDLVKWGYLVKMWATQTAYPGVPVKAVPLTLKAFVKQCKDAGVKVTIPEGVTGICFVQQSAEVVTVRLPSASMVKAAEEYLERPDTEYPDVPIYNMYSSTPFKIPKEEKLEFHAARIGDYTLSQCG
jgi:hypothetical protein